MMEGDPLTPDREVAGQVVVLEEDDQVAVLVAGKVAGQVAGRVVVGHGVDKITGGVEAETDQEVGARNEVLTVNSAVIS